MWGDFWAIFISNSISSLQLLNRKNWGIEQP